MKLFVLSGNYVEISLDRDQELEFEYSSPFFEDAGEQSWPFTIPATPSNLSVLGHPERIAAYKSTYVTRNLPARLYYNGGYIDGILLVDSVSDIGISASFVSRESDLYSRYKDISLTDLFKDIYRDDFSTPTAWAEYFRKCFAGEVTDEDFTVFPVLCDRYEDNEGQEHFFILNEPSLEETVGGFSTLIHSARTVDVSADNSEYVPEGYGLTPFLKLHQFLKRMFLLMGYALTSDVFSSGQYSDIVLINTCADTICEGMICFKDIVPSCTIGEFLQILKNKFCISAIVDPRSRSVKIVMFDAILRATENDDINLNTEDNHEVFFGQPKTVRLSSDTSLELAAPAAESMEKLVETFIYINHVNWEEEAIGDYGAWMQLHTGNIYVRELLKDSREWRIRRLGSNIFPFSRNIGFEMDEHEASDTIPAMCCVYGSRSENEPRLVAAYAGSRRHMRTAVLSSDRTDEESGQRVIFLFDAGKRSIGSGTVYPAYRLGTTQMYDNSGNKFRDWSLMPEDIYKIFWSAYDSVLRNTHTDVALTVHFPRPALFRPSGIYMYRGQRLILKKSSWRITAAGTAEYGRSEFMIASDFNNILEDIIQIPASFSWQVICSVDDDIKDYISEKIASIVAQTGVAVADPEYTWSFALPEKEVYVYYPFPQSLSDRIDGLRVTVNVILKYKQLATEYTFEENVTFPARLQAFPLVS